MVAQFKGKGEVERMKSAAGQLLFATPISAIVACVILVAFADPLVHFLFAGVEEAVLTKAEHYLIGIAISMIFLSVYMSGFAVFRGLGETKICLHLTIIINLLHFIASFVFINLMHLDIMGSVLSLNLARIVGGAAAIWMLLSPKSVLRVQARHVFRIDKKIIREIFRIGIPFGMEQLFMNGGSMLVQIYIARLGTMNVAANAVANSAFSLLYAAPSAVGNLAVTVVGQCVGAGEKGLAVHPETVSGAGQYAVHDLYRAGNRCGMHALFLAFLQYHALGPAFRGGCCLFVLLFPGYHVGDPGGPGVCVRHPA